MIASISSPMSKGVFSSAGTTRAIDAAARCTGGAGGAGGAADPQLAGR